MRLAEEYSGVKERTQIILLVPVLLGVGVGIYFLIPFEPSFARVTAVFSGLLMLAYVCFYVRWHRPLIGVLGVVVIVAGCGAAMWRTDRVVHQVLEKPLGPVWIEGTVRQFEFMQKGARLTLENLRARTRRTLETPMPDTARLVIRTKMQETLYPGDRVKMLARLEPLARPAIPDGYDYARSLYFQGIAATGFSLSPVERIGDVTPESGIRQLRHQINIRMLSVLQGTTGAIATALITGERGVISREVNDNMRVTGLMHILSISGLHMAIFCGFFFFLIRYSCTWIPGLVTRYDTKRIAAFLALVAGFFYLLIAGAPVPAQRAYIMIALFFLAVLLGRVGTPMRPVALSAIVILLLQPEALVSVSFQMSYASVIAIIAGYEWWARHRPERHKDPGISRRVLLYFFGIVSTSILAGAATAPFGAFHFGSIPPFGILANMLAIPLTSFLVIPLGFIAIIAMPFSLEKLPLLGMGFGVDLMVEWSAWVASVSPGLWIVPQPHWAIFACMACGGLWLCLCKTNHRLWGVVPIVAGICIAMIPAPKPDIFVEETGKLIAIRSPQDEWTFNTRRTRRYARKALLQQMGQTQAPLWKERTKEMADFRCEDALCVLEREDRRIALLLRSEAATALECARYDFIIQPFDERRFCGKTPALTAKDLRRNGSYLLTLNDHPRGSGVDIQHVKGVRGERPWSR